MSPRWTILYLFLASCLRTTATALPVDPAAISDSCPHLPAISFPPGRSSLTRSAKSLLRQAAPIALSCDSCKICLVVSCQFSCGRDNTSNQVCWDRGIRTANYLCNNLHVPENRVAFTYAGNGPPDKLTLEWVSRSEWPDTPSPHSKLHPADTIILHFNLNQSSLSPEADTIIDQYFSSHIKPSRPLRISGYCDQTGANVYNNRLSLRRARTVNDYLRQHWLNSTAHIELAGYGTRYPVADNKTDFGRALNRRVSIILETTAPTTAPTTTPTITPTITADPRPVDPPPAAQSPRSIYKAITDTNTRVGTSLVLKDVVFYGGRRIPLPSSYIVLDDLVKAMKENEKLHIRIEGHVCCIPDSTDGPDLDTGKPGLSVQRAKVVFDYLIKHGISKDRMIYIGLGASGKLYPQEIGMAQQAANRRVEIRIISK